jgi:threonine dehydrogenase-like Zn-dependent dehydrogenase
MVQAAVQVGPREIELREFPKPQIGLDDGLLRVEACGICGSDVEQFKGTLRREGAQPSILGHEVLGVVEEVGEHAAVRWGVHPGDRVALEILIPCRSCERCLDGRYMSCRHMQGAYSGSTPVDREPALWGGFAEYVYLHPNAILHKMDGALPPEFAVMFNPLGAGVRWASDLGGTRLGDTVLVLGPGQRGIAAVIAAKASGARTVIVTGLTRDAHKLELAREFGADFTIDVEQADTVEQVREITGGAMADVVLEVTPIASQPVGDAVEAVAPGGRIVLAGLKGGREIGVVTDRLIGKGATLIGAYGVDSRAYSQAIQIIESGRFPLERLHTHTFGLADASLAIETLAGEAQDTTAVHVSIAPGK